MVCCREEKLSKEKASKPHCLHLPRGETKTWSVCVRFFASSRTQYKHTWSSCVGFLLYDEVRNRRFFTAKAKKTAFPHFTDKSTALLCCVVLVIEPRALFMLPTLKLLWDEAQSPLLMHLPENLAPENRSSQVLAGLIIPWGAIVMPPCFSQLASQHYFIKIFKYMGNFKALYRGIYITSPYRCFNDICSITHSSILFLKFMCI